MFRIDDRTLQAPGFTREALIRALGRAAEDGIAVRPAVTPGEVMVESGGNVYRATWTTCTCRAGQFDRLCTHRALYVYFTDELGLDVAHGVSAVRLPEGREPAAWAGRARRLARGSRPGNSTQKELS